MLAKLQQQQQQLQQLQLAVGATPTGTDPIEEDGGADAEMPQQLALQSTAAKRGAETAGTCLQETETALKKLKALRGKYSPNASAASAPGTPRGSRG